MKNSLLGAGILLAGIMAFAGTLTVAGAALRHPEHNTVLTVTCTQSAAEEETVLFPYAIADTALVVEKLVMYEGPMVEQGSDEPMAYGLGLVLRNTGREEILCAQILLHKPMVTHRFSGCYIPGESAVLLVEADGAPWTDGGYTSCTGTVQYVDQAGLTEQEVTVVETGMGEVSITNLTELLLTDVELIYKNYLSDARIYIGGIAYRTKVGELEPGQTIKVPLTNYAQGYSRIVRVEGQKKM